MTLTCTDNQILDPLCRSGAMSTVHGHAFDSKTLHNIVHRGEWAFHLRDMRETICREAVDQEHVRQTVPAYADWMLTYLMTYRVSRGPGQVAS